MTVSAVCCLSLTLWHPTHGRFRLNDFPRTTDGNFAILLTVMATSSITANIEIKDPAAARAFVDALLSTEPWPQPKPTVCASYFASDEEAHSFFRRSPYAQKVGVR